MVTFNRIKSYPSFGLRSALLVETYVGEFDLQALLLPAKLLQKIKTIHLVIALFQGAVEKGSS